ncbi:MAG: DoxX family membrane protein [Proteobacteria bacterium]|nr:DoxX family membrane protein [Pseudomonadota bacterium]
MVKATKAVRIILGLIFVVFGINYFYEFLPPQPPPQGIAGEYISALLKTGYFFPVLKVCEISCGIALVTGFFVPLALVVIAPVIVQINLFHFFLSPPVSLAVTLLVMGLFLGWAYRKSYVEILKPR